MAWGDLFGPLNQGLGTLGQVANVANLFRRPSPRLGVGSNSRNPSGWPIPPSLLGAGLTLAAPYANQEPGYAVEARQGIRNFLTPEQQVGQFGSYLSQLGQNNPYQALLNQTRQRDIADIQQRFTAAFPASVGAQGPEFGTLSRYITDQALPREQAASGDLAQSFMNRQLESGQSLLNYAKPSGLSEALGQLGGLLMYGNPQQASKTDGANLPIGADARGGTVPPSEHAREAQLLDQTGNVIRGVPQLSQLIRGQLTPPELGQDVADIGGLSFRTPAGSSAPIGIDEARQLAAQGYGNRIASGSGQSVAAGGIPGLQGMMRGQGFLGAPGLSSVAGIASGAGAAGFGYQAGNMAGSQIDRPGTQFGDIAKYGTPFGFTSNKGLQAASAGAVSGAATGWASGGPIGAVIGAIAGGIGGFTGERSTRIARKEGQIAQETAQTAQARPEAIASFQQGSQAGFQTVAQLDQLLAHPQVSQQIAQLIQTDPEAQQIYQASLDPAATAHGSFLDPVSPDQWLAKMRQYIASRSGTVSDPKSLIVQQIQNSADRGNFFPAQQQGQQLIGESQQAMQLVRRMLAKLGVA